MSEDNPTVVVFGMYVGVKHRRKFAKALNTHATTLRRNYGATVHVRYKGSSCRVRLSIDSNMLATYREADGGELIKRERAPILALCKEFVKYD